MWVSRVIKGLLQLISQAAVALVAVTGVASAGGFEITEQSTVSLGAASAGVAAGGSIGSMYSNPAAAGQFSGLNTESSYTVILPNADVHVTLFGGGPAQSDGGNVALDALTSAVYGTYQVSKDLWVGMGINSPFGLSTKPENKDYLGSYLGVTSKLITINANPTIAYRIAPGIIIGAGVQMEWAQAKLQFRQPLSLIPANDPIAEFKGDDWAFGGTAGVLIEPVPGTSIGLGYRSQLTHDFSSNLKNFFVPSGGALVSVPADSTLNLPDIVTLSLRQMIAPDMRLMGTVEWTNWSRFKDVALTLPGPTTLAEQANWSDGWFFSVGGEYDYSPLLTLRSGVAYELSPIDDPTKRLVQVPDNNRVWLNIGASYKCDFCRALLHSEETTLDIGYSHAFVQDGGFNDRTPGTSIPITGYVNNAHFDLVSLGLRTHW